MNNKILSVFFAILAAALYAVNVPFSKSLMSDVAPTMMAAFLYLGAGAGLLVYSTVEKLFGKTAIKEPLTIKELPYTIAMIVLDIAAPILLMLGFVSYGLSINFYISVQKHLGAAKTSAFYSIAPFLGVAFSMLLLKELPGLQFLAALLIMIPATILMIKDSTKSD